MKNATVAIVVIFNPDKEGLCRLIDSLIAQVSQVLIIDNGCSEEVKSYLLSLGALVEWVSLGENKGIAFAQNFGIKLAKEKGAESLIFFDQDSIPSPGMVEALVTGLNALESSGRKVSAVGPLFIDSRKNVNYAPDNLRVSRFTPSETLISSGSLIPVSVLNAVGLMAEELFIDYVDLNWCLQAKAMGYNAYLVNDAAMFHSLGDNLIKFMGKEWPSRSPLRHYYMCRNAIWMYGRSWPSLRWKLIDFFKLLRKIIFYTLFAQPRLEQVQMMSLGLWHGVIGKMGKYSP